MLLPMGMMPGAAAVWALIAPLQLRFARDRSSAPRLLAALAALVAFIVLASLVVAAPYGEILLPNQFISAVAGNAYAVFGVLIPWLVISVISFSGRRLTWWQSALLGAGVVVACAVIWLVLGIALHVETD